MKTKCDCGSNKVNIATMTLVLHGVPCKITKTGVDYDDADAEASEGWDYLVDNLLVCVKCRKRYRVAKDADNRVAIRPDLGR